MPELISVPLTIIAGIITVGIIVEAMNKGISNLSRQEETMFLIAVLVLIISLAL